VELPFEQTLFILRCDFPDTVTYGLIKLNIEIYEHLSQLIVINELIFIGVVTHKQFQESRIVLVIGSFLLPNNFLQVYEPGQSLITLSLGSKREDPSTRLNEYEI
jgi:hypothetical protein